MYVSCWGNDGRLSCRHVQTITSSRSAIWSTTCRIPSIQDSRFFMQPILEVLLCILATKCSLNELYSIPFCLQGFYMNIKYGLPISLPSTVVSYSATSGGWPYETPLLNRESATLLIAKNPEGLRHDFEDASPPTVTTISSLKKLKRLRFEGFQKLAITNHHSEATRKKILPKNPLQKKSSHVGWATFGDLTPRQAAKTQNLWRRGHDRPDRCRWSAAFFGGLVFYPQQKEGKKTSQNQGTWKPLESKYHFF